MTVDEELLHRYLAFALLASGIAAAIALFVRPAPYGRYSEAQGWGPLIDPQLAWLLMESPNVFVSAMLWDAGGNAPVKSKANQVLLGLFVLHYVNRAFIYPVRKAAGKPMPLSVMLMAWIFCCCNGCLQARFLTKFYIYPDEWLYSPIFALGVVVFFTGFYINLDSDRILRELRKKGAKTERESTHIMRTRRQAKEEPETERHSGAQTSSYRIPRGGLFEYVSGANYFGEVVEWTGFALACGGSLPSVTFALFTILNLAPRAFHHHLWYRTRFGNRYPTERKALVPFLF
jgi:3-oxo-5-alpha-steroid 4-dehydrogenase 1